MEKLLIVLLVAIAPLLTGIGTARTQQSEAPSRDSFVIGLVPERNIFKQVGRYAPLADYLSRKCGFDVRIKIATSYGDAVNGFGQPGMDAAFLGSFSYVLAHEKFGAEVIARPERPDGSSTYHGLLFVRQDSGIRTIRDMRGKSFAFVDKQTLAGFLLPLVYLRSHGIRNYRTFFRETYFAGTHEDAIYDVLNGKADIGAAKSTVYHSLALDDRRIERELKILSRSPDVPDNAFVVRKEVKASVRASIEEGLLTMDSDPEGRQVLSAFGARRFIQTTDGEFEPVREYVRRLGLDLKRYDVSGKK